MAGDLTSTTRPGDTDRVIYATITMMSVLIIYDGWNHLSYSALVAVIAGPVVAMFFSHVFSSILARQVALGRVVTMHERLGIVRTESRFLLIGLPPLFLAGILMLAGLELSQAIRWVLAAGMIWLGYLGGVAGRRAQLGGWRVMLAVLAGFLIGAAILVLQVTLQPGRAVSGGTV